LKPGGLQYHVKKGQGEKQDEEPYHKRIPAACLRPAHLEKSSRTDAQGIEAEIPQAFPLEKPRN
jgi:hypothetical protein